MTTRIAAGLALFSVLSLGACSEKKPAAPPVVAASVTPVAAPATAPLPTAAPKWKIAGMRDDAPAKEVANAFFFHEQCANCHGSTGRGDGAAFWHSPQGRLAPQDLADPEWQASVTDSTIRKAILHGGEAVGLSDKMPAHAVLRDRPEVVDELVKIVRSFRKPGPRARGWVVLDRDCAMRENETKCLGIWADQTAIVGRRASR